MTVGKAQFYRRFKVIFGPQEKDKFLDRFPKARCISMRPRTDLKPWGTREAVMEETVDTGEIFGKL